jgi:hypothetical protein
MYERDVAVVAVVVAAAPVIPPAVILVESSSFVRERHALLCLAMPTNDISLHLHRDPPLPPVC